MYYILALYGKSGSGKDTLLQKLCEAFPELHKVILTTTRPKRDYEEEDIDYHFTTTEDFKDKILKDEVCACAIYKNEWYYGIERKELDENKINIVVLSPTEIDELCSDTICETYKILVKMANDKDRLIRLLDREENPDCVEICRRFVADDTDFRCTYIKPTFVYNNDSEKMNLTDDLIIFVKSLLNKI